MAMKALDPAPKAQLRNGYDLVASEAGRSSQGSRVTVSLFNGDVKAYRTIIIGDPKAQQTLITDFAGMTQLDHGEITAALVHLAIAVEGVLRQMADQDEETPPSQATRLVQLALDAGIELFHAPGADGEAYATIPVDGHTETWPLKVKYFRNWLKLLFYRGAERSPGSQAVQDALGVLEGKALFDGPEYPVYTRLAAHAGAIYLDLGNARWQAVEITAQGWRVVDEPPVKFRRSRGMLPLPTPIPRGSLADLRPYCNLGSEVDWRLLVSWLLATLRPTGPYPVLVVHGEQGSAKSTLFEVLRSLVDPNTAALRTVPRDERDLVIAATNGHLIALDNLSHLPDWLSDAFCRLATGGGFATRELYTDGEEAIFAATRPIMLNGIEELATRGDLLDRAIIVYLPAIPEDKRQEKNVFWQRFEQARPMILGALLDIVSHALHTLPSVHLVGYPRMADFAKWSGAAAGACGWTVQDFEQAYQGVREATYALTLEASPVGPLLQQWVDAQPQHTWEGTATELLLGLETRLDQTSDKQPKRPQGWPKNGRALSNTLRRLAPTLRQMAVMVEWCGNTGTERRRLIRLSRTAPSPASETAEREMEVF